tara:strand:+ start:4183 stop:4512 length:330 start_codon:yes stop_codon:yes gene_type:complete
LINSLSLNDNGDSTWGVGYQSSDAIGGFQFTIEGASVISADGGDADTNGFTMSLGSGNAVIGFSLPGASIPAGAGTLLTLELDGTPSRLVSLVISGEAGASLDFTFGGF